MRAVERARRAVARPDLLSELVHVEEEGDRLTDDELVATCVLLLFAGHETTTHHLANGLAALMRFPGELERLRADPALAPAAVEELLRYDGPIGAQVRIVTVPQQMHGKQLRAGERVFVLLNAANRDPRAYPEPDRVDLDVGVLGGGFVGERAAGAGEELLRLDAAGAGLHAEAGHRGRAGPVDHGVIEVGAALREAPLGVAVGRQGELEAVLEELHVGEDGGGDLAAGDAGRLGARARDQTQDEERAHHQ